MFKRYFLKVLLVIFLLPDTLLLGSVYDCCNDQEHCKQMITSLENALASKDTMIKRLSDELAKKELQEKKQPLIGTKTALFSSVIIAVAVVFGLQQRK